MNGVYIYKYKPSLNGRFIVGFGNVCHITMLRLIFAWPWIGVSPPPLHAPNVAVFVGPAFGSVAEHWCWFPWFNMVQRTKSHDSQTVNISEQTNFGIIHHLKHPNLWFSRLYVRSFEELDRLIRKCTNTVYCLVVYITPSRKKTWLLR